ncbi:hypothetical protein FRC06_002772, partial [Ceratobasidium sp. 370]
ITRVKTHSAQLQEWADKQHIRLTWDCTNSRLPDGRPVNKVTPIIKGQPYNEFTEYDSQKQVAKNNSAKRLGLSGILLYDIAPETQLLCINIRTSSIINFPFDEPHGTLYVPSRALLDLLTRREIRPDGGNIAARIPWGDWANLTSWIDTRDFKTNNERYMYGQRIAAFSAEVEFPGDGLFNAITILDFDERRVRAQRAAGPGLAGEVCMPQATEVDLDQEVDDSVLPVHERSCGRSFFEGDNVPGKAYLRTLIGIPSSYMGMFSSIMMDNEHG